jgi:putative PIN family toxin of toxin-antitoxin system
LKFVILLLDIDLVVAGFRGENGIARQLLLAALEQRIVILLSVPLMLEYEAVLTRSEQLDATGLTASQVNRVLDALAKVAERVPLRFLWRPRLKDPADEMVLETAVNGRADVLVSFNTRRLRDAGVEFGLRVCTPREFWKDMGGSRYEKK